MQPQPQPANRDNGKRHKSDKKRTRSSEGEVEDEMSIFEEVKLVKERRIELVKDPRFMTEARRKELEWERLSEESEEVKRLRPPPQSSSLR